MSLSPSGLAVESVLLSGSPSVLQLESGVSAAHRARRSTLVSQRLLPKRPLEALGRRFFPGSQAAPQRKAARRTKPAFWKVAFQIVFDVRRSRQNRKGYSQLLPFTEDPSDITRPLKRGEFSLQS